MKNSKASQKGSSVIIAVVVIILIIFVLNHYGITVHSILASIKNFFGI